MLNLSPLARQLIDEGVAALPNPQHRRVWTNWTREHPKARRPDDPLDDGRGPFPHEILNIILAALEHVSTKLLSQRARPALSEDEIADLDNDLSYVRSVERAVHETERRPPSHANSSEQATVRANVRR